MDTLPERTTEQQVPVSDSPYAPHLDCAARDTLEQRRARGEYDAIWAFICAHEMRMSVETADFLLHLLDDFPPQYAEQQPLLPVMRARLLLNNGKFAACGEILTRIVAAYERNPSPDESARAVAGEAYLFLGLMSLLSFDEQFAEQFRRAARCLPQGSRLIDDRLCFSEGNYMLLIRDPSPGSLLRHVERVFEALPYAVRAMNGAGYGIKHVTRAEAAYCTCDLKNAEFYAYKAIYRAEQVGQYDTICAATFVLLRVYLYGGQFAKAEACLNELREKLELVLGGARTRGFLCTYDILTGWYYARLGDLDRVPAWMFQKEKRDRTLPPNSLARDPLIRAYCLLVGERDYQLMAYLDVIACEYDERGLLPARIETHAFRAIAAHRLGQQEIAMEALGAAYALASGNGMIMPFVELGRHMRALLYTARQLESPPAPVSWMDEVSAKAATYEKRLRSARVQYHRSDGTQTLLTRRESEILHHLCQGLTSEEIAGILYVSTSTVKKALISIYSKLGASNRADAVRIAMQSGLC